MQRRFVLTGLLAAVLMAFTAPVVAAQSTSGNATQEGTTQINLNTAKAAELEKLPGVGPATAARIIEYREQNGPFKKIEDLMHVRGIGEKTFLKLKPLVTVTPPKLLTR